MTSKERRRAHRRMKHQREALLEMENMYGKDVRNHHWCLEYLGSGHYFDTARQLMDYYRSRKFKKPFGPPL